MDTNWDESVILDLVHLSEFTGGNDDVRDSALRVFVENAPQYYELLVASDADNWKERAHKLKGAARSLGAWRTAKQGERAEFLEGPYENEAARLDCLSELKARLDELISHIQLILKGDTE
ncbi:Hpt domain-containing protein [Kordiimonas sp. SCSIO 12610]|uniref:Hpt domain-containing protein n=1 Tax=Kordiimonas sp. SCSIO 12610 TaxID=2829597 RepID=UPI00210D0AFF|nr:Hpt domain-containing protein [Kordiimonas sp. SCSIO 12610]UTW54202.1 Hpt domain-containing protein [Kordiimonas sp. SCSIO 12610]